MRQEQEPVERPSMHARHDSSSKTYDHPAFGQIAASRVSGTTTLFGSDFLHHAFVSIRISRSSLSRDLSRDWYHPREELIEVRLSEAQWATFVSSMNVGTGVPCTIDFVAGQGQMPSIPMRQETDAIRADFDARIEQAVARVDAAIAAVEGEIGASLSGKKREAVLGELRSTRQEIASNLPFVVRSFEEHMEATVEKAKVEVNAYVQSTVMRAGIAALAGGEAPFLLAPAPNGSEAP